MQEWDNFKGTKWKQIIDVDDFVINNYSEYVGNSDFLRESSKKTNKVWGRCQKLLEKESITDILDIEINEFSGIDTFECGYIDKKNETIVGIQTDDPLKRFINPYVSLNSSLSVLKNNGYRFNKDMISKFNYFSKSYEDVVENTYTSEIKKYKEVHLLEGLPDNYGRGFILGDYRRIALYGIDYLINKKKNDLQRLKKDINYSMVRVREEVVNQIEALNEIKSMASRYGYNISLPASNSKEAIQWIYFGYLAALKQTTGISIPLGNISAFIDIYIERDLAKGIISEDVAQELIDQFTIKLRMIRFLYPQEIQNYYLGETIIPITLGSVVNTSSLITKTDYRIINSIENLGEYKTVNYTILWSKSLPINFKKYCCKIITKYNSLQFCNGDIITNNTVASTGIANLSKVGKQIDYYGGTCNLPKILLYAINGGKDEFTGETIVEGIEPIDTDILDYSKVARNFSLVLSKVISIQCDAINTIHCLYDKYAYESSIMALNDTVVERYATIGMSGFSVLVDSLSAIKYSTVTIKRNENGIVNDFSVDNNFPRFGNNLNEVDSIAIDVVKLFNQIVREHHLYRNAKAKIEIASYGLNIVYGKNTGATPDGRFSGVAYSEGVCPTSNVSENGLLSSLKSIIKIPIDLCKAGIVNTLNITHSTFGAKKGERIDNILELLDNIFNDNISHVEINLIDKNLLLEDKNNSLILRNNGYLIAYDKLNSEQQESIIDSTFYKVI